eukprot:CAMPEP_0119549236 /NCGR_PEP_ID=MMETSP1352-20130426/2987_1 /TAXON_ID=265584 /ORGANISM="Stauroneis constricta, Strain CCMP1120" /LENGTH=773 /DNA_ID=CAMNT_0007594741 /DNA_START=161 /DNA_END=2482 /DNA_ORIENTATION=-
MYAQYQSYGQPAVAVQQQQVWNGQAWVMSNAVGNGGGMGATHSAYTHQTNGIVAAARAPHPNANAGANTNSINHNQVIPPNPVATFTQYYQQWKQSLDQQEAYLRQLASSDFATRQETERRITWYKYYADQSSRAAHFFHQNPNAVTVPFELPPDPASYGATAAPAATATATATATAVNNQPNAQQPTNHYAHNNSHFVSQGNNRTETVAGSAAPTKPVDVQQTLKDYVQRCQAQCSTAAERKAMHSLIELSVAKAIQSGTFATKDWTHEPLAQLPAWKNQRRTTAQSTSTSPKQQLSEQRKQQQAHTARASGDKSVPPPPSPSNGHYGPASSDHDVTTMRATPVPSWLLDKRAKRKTPSSSSSSSFPSSLYSDSNSNPNFSRHGNSDDSKQRNMDANKKRKLAKDNDFIGFDDVNDDDKAPSQRSKRSSAKKQGKKNKNGLDRSSKALSKRANRFSGPGGIQDVTTSSSSIGGQYDKYMGKSMLGGNQKQKLDEADYEQMTVKGTCTVLEKEYLRLTAPPRAELVRPKPILEQHVANLKAEYERNKTKKRDYLWFCSQFKAVRQDCTVQRLQGELAVDAYETHAKIALEQGDLNEYNQCQTQLKELYSLDDASLLQNYEEFVAYRLLYYVFLSTNESYDGGSSDLFKIMLSLTADQRKHKAIHHALQVRAAVADNDYHAFFRLHKNTPNLGRFLTTRIVPAMRLRALRRMTKAYRPSVQAKFCVTVLGFETTIDEGIEWIKRCGAIVDDKGNFVTKNSNIHEPEEAVKNSLI